MIYAEMKIISPSGLHLRPAAELIQVVSRHRSTVKIRLDEQEITVDSIIHLLKLGIKQGSSVTLITDGPDEEETMQAIRRQWEQSRVVAPEGTI